MQTDIHTYIHICNAITLVWGLLRLASITVTNTKILIMQVPRANTLRSNYQGLTFTPLLTPTVDTTYCNVVLQANNEISELILCDTGIGNVQKTIIWGLRSIGGNVDEVEISTVSSTQCPVHSHIHSSTEIFREVNTGKSGD